jgi:hypothetical protein
MKLNAYPTGNITDRISKQVFLAVYDSYLPNEWIKFTFKYFSTSTLPKDKKVSNIMRDLLIILFLLGFLGTVLNLNHSFIKCMLLPFTIILFLWGILKFGAFIMNNARIKKIMKLLKINKDEYNALVSAYL